METPRRIPFLISVSLPKFSLQFPRYLSEASSQKFTSPQGPRNISLEVSPVGVTPPGCRQGLEAHPGSGGVEGAASRTDELDQEGGAEAPKVFKSGVTNSIS